MDRIIVVVVGKTSVIVSWEQEHFKKIYIAAIIRTHSTTPPLGKTVKTSAETKPT